MFLIQKNLFSLLAYIKLLYFKTKVNTCINEAISVLIGYICVYISQGKCMMIVQYIGKSATQQKTQIMLAVFIISLFFVKTTAA